MLLAQQVKYVLLVGYRSSHHRLVLLAITHHQLLQTLAPSVQLVPTVLLKLQLCLARLVRSLMLELQLAFHVLPAINALLKYILLRQPALLEPSPLVEALPVLHAQLDSLALR